MPSRRDPARGEKNVKAGSGAKVEHNLPRLQLGQHGRVPAAEADPLAEP